VRKPLSIPPPADYLTFSPSELFRFFFQIGRWTEDSFSADFQNYTRGKLISTVTINKWKNHDVIPTRYSGPIIKMIEDKFEPRAAQDWIAAFETVWATHAARPNKRSGLAKNTNLSDNICRQHSAWIKTRYYDMLPRESFSAADIYVPLQLIDRKRKTETLFEVEDILKTNFVESEDYDWIFICGGPGSGKSMAAIHLAHELTKTNVFPIYLRGSHLSEIDIDIKNTNQPVIDSFSIKSFLQHFRASSQNTACLILDGIDEISGGGTDSTSALKNILKDLSLEQNVCLAHDKRLYVVALGRQSHVGFASNIIAPQRAKYLDMLGLDGCDPHSPEHTSLGQDLRSEWWHKYLAAIGRKPDPLLPDFLATDYDDYSEFGADPLLTYLICHLALGNAPESSSERLAHERVNALTYAKNKNEIYENIIKHIHARTSFQNGQSLQYSHFQSVLQHIALVNWHAGEHRAVSLKHVQDSLKDERTLRAFQALNLTSPGMFITAFYYRIAHDDTAKDQAMLEFTHKSFSEYLISTLIFESFLQLITAFSAQEGLEAALINWERISHAGTHEPSLADFCQKEATLRYDDFSRLNWDSALTLIREQLIGMGDKKGIEAISESQRSASLLFFLWSCLNIERHKRTGNLFKLIENSNGFTSFDLKRIQLPNALILKAGALTDPQLQHRRLLTPSLSALNLDNADLSQLSFSIGHMKAMFQAVKIQLSSFIDCRLKNITFSQCHFSDVDFISLDIEGVIFDRCTFTNCNFEITKNPADTNSITFRHSTFLEMQTNIEKMNHHIFEDCMFPNNDLNKEKRKKHDELDKNIGALLL